MKTIVLFISLIFLSIFTQATTLADILEKVKILNVDERYIKYKDSVIASDFNFLTFEIDEKFDKKSENQFVIYFNEKKEIKKISKRNKNIKYQNFDIYVFHNVLDSLSIGFMEMQHKERKEYENWFIDNFFIFDIKNKYCSLVSLYPFFDSCTIIDENEKAIGIEIGISSISTSEIQRIFQLDLKTP